MIYIQMIAVFAQYTATNHTAVSLTCHLLSSAVYIMMIIIYFMTIFVKVIVGPTANTTAKHF